MPSLQADPTQQLLQPILFSLKGTGTNKRKAEDIPIDSELKLGPGPVVLRKQYASLPQQRGEYKRQKTSESDVVSDFISEVPHPFQQNIISLLQDIPPKFRKDAHRIIFEVLRRKGFPRGTVVTSYPVLQSFVNTVRSVGRQMGANIT